MKFKKGDRVSVYGFSELGFMLEGAHGTVQDLYSDGFLKIKFDALLDESPHEVHERQCVRLVKKNAKTS